MRLPLARSARCLAPCLGLLAGCADEYASPSANPGAAQDTSIEAGPSSVTTNDAGPDTGSAQLRDASGAGSQDASAALAHDAAPEQDAERPDAAPLDCSFSGTPGIAPADVEIESRQQFALQGISALPEGCVTWSVSPSSFSVYNSSSSNHVRIDPFSGALEVSNLPDDVDLTIFARVADREVARASVHYFNPGRVFDDVFHEVAVLRCPDYAEAPRQEIGEVFFDPLQVTFHPFETFVNYRGQLVHIQDPQDPRRGTIMISDVTGTGFDPADLRTQGTYRARQDGRLELRDVWLGPDQAQCGHVFERYK